MQAFITDYEGAEYLLPALIEWDMSHGIGTPCDAFEVRFVCDGRMREALSDAIRFRAEHDGETVFVGVVDEFNIKADERGIIGTIRGRGLSALLLDNEAEAAEYFGASMDFILNRHVYPWGIKDVRAEEIIIPGLFTVQSGSSQWRVLEDFARFGGGFRPRFSRDGVLLLNSTPGRVMKIDETTPISSFCYTERRYGVISQALVKNRSWAYSSTVDNAEFLARGGCRRQVITMPRNSHYDALRSTGEYQIEKSAEGKLSLVLIMPKLFAAFPLDLVSISSDIIKISGDFYVWQSRCFANERGAGTVLTLYDGKG